MREASGGRRDPFVRMCGHRVNMGLSRAITSTAGSRPGPAGSGPPLWFPGQYYDPEIDLFENWNRYYAPYVGRYLQPDPDPPYGYARNNPLAFIDPTGLCTVVCHRLYVGFWRCVQLDDDKGYWAKVRQFFDPTNGVCLTGETGYGLALAMSC